MQVTQERVSTPNTFSRVPVCPKEKAVLYRSLKSSHQAKAFFENTKGIAKFKEECMEKTEEDLKVHLIALEAKLSEWVNSKLRKTGWLSHMAADLIRLKCDISKIGDRLDIRFIPGMLFMRAENKITLLSGDPAYLEVMVNHTAIRVDLTCSDGRQAMARLSFPVEERLSHLLARSSIVIQTLNSKKH